MDVLSRTSYREAVNDALADRVKGALVGLAAGDALGAPYEFGPPPVGEAEMRPGGLGPWEAGEWTDDTQMSICVALGLCGRAVRGDGDRLLRAPGPALVAENFMSWFGSPPKDVGIQTSSVLMDAGSAERMAGAAAAYFRTHPDGAAGNGSLMRTAPVALATTGSDSELSAMAAEVSALTHGDPQAGDACVLWCVAIDRAINESRLDGILDGLELISPQRRSQWAERIECAGEERPETFTPNGFVVTALQAALAAVWQTAVPEDDPPSHLRLALQAAVHIGDDSDTVAAIAGALLGARWGASAVPGEWREVLHGWPGYRVGDLEALALACAGDPTAPSFPAL